MIEKINDGSYVQELDQLMKNIDISKGDCKEYLRFLVFTIDFKQENTVYRTITIHIIANRIADKFNMTHKDEDMLYYASLLYDIGMITVSDNITNSPRNLTERERDLVNWHVNIAGEFLDGLMPREVLEIASRHHERLNGKGYPQQLKEEDLTLPSATT